MNALDQRMNATQQMNDALEHAKVVAVNDSGEMAVWSGGYGFNVYDAAGDWREVDYFSNGELAGMTDVGEKEPVARAHLKERGFTPLTA